MPGEDMAGNEGCQSCTCGWIYFLDAGPHGVDEAAGGEGARRLAEGSPALADCAISHAGQRDQSLLLKLLLPPCPSTSACMTEMPPT